MKSKRFLMSITLFILLTNISFAQVTDTGGQPITIMVLSPLILGLFFLLGAFLLNPDEHGVLRIFLFLLSLTTIFMHLWFAVLTLIKYYDFDPLQEALGDSVWIYGSMIGIVIVYFLIYAFYKMTHAAAQKKDEMMLQ